MKFTYKDTEYALVDPDDWTTLDAIQVQEASGHSPAEIVMDIRKFGPLGLHAMGWISVRRAGVDVAWDKFDLPYFDTLQTANGVPVQEAPDPSPASTRPSSGARAGRVSRAAPARKSKSTSAGSSASGSTSRPK